MTGMIEKMARAIFAARDGTPYAGENIIREAGWHLGCETAVTQARAVLEAMQAEDLKLELAKRKFDDAYSVTDDGCFEWIGAVDRRDGYGCFYDGTGKTIGAHVFAWRYEHGNVPSGKVVDHICRNRKCVNVTHLRLLSNGENVLAGEGVTALNARKDFCKNGHPLSGDNLYVRPDGNRDCKQCRRETSRRYKAKKRTMIQAAIEEGV